MRISEFPRKAALSGIATIVTVSTVTAFTESYRGLYEWASHHRLTQGWAVAWPVQVDAFIALGELALFLGIVDKLPGRARLFAWCVTITGAVVSVLGNIGHVGGSATVEDKVTAAVPPCAAFFGLMVGLQILKWTLHSVPASVPLSAERSTLNVVVQPNTAADSSELVREIAAVSGPVKAVRAPRGTGGDMTQHPQYANGVAVYRGSLAAGKRLTQVQLAGELGMTNRKLAKVIMTNVDQETAHGDFNGVPSPA